MLCSSVHYYAEHFISLLCSTSLTDALHYTTMQYITPQCIKVQPPAMQCTVYHFLPQLPGAGGDSNWQKLPPPTIQYSTVHCSTTQFCTVQYSTVQYSEVQYSTAEYSTILCSPVQNTELRHNTVYYTTPLDTAAQRRRLAE